MGRGTEFLPVGLGDRAMSWWAHLSWSQAAFWLCVALLVSGALSSLIGRFMAGPDNLRSSHPDQFANTSRRSYVSYRGLS